MSGMTEYEEPSPPDEWRLQQLHGTLYTKSRKDLLDLADSMRDSAGSNWSPEELAVLERELQRRGAEWSEAAGRYVIKRKRRRMDKSNPSSQPMA